MGILALFKGGVETHRGNHLAYSAATMGIMLSVMIQLAATNTVEIHVQGNSAAAMNTDANTNYFGGYLISHT